MEATKRWILDFVLNRIPGLNKFWAYLNGRKTELGKLLVGLNSILLLLQELAPSLEFLPELVNGFTSFITWFFLWLGLKHKEIKAEQEARIEKEVENVLDQEAKENIDA